MKMTLRWFGPLDTVPLNHIKQIPNVTGVVSAVYDIAVGEVWPHKRISALIGLAKKQNLGLEVIESVPVHEDIKLGIGKRDYYIQNYKENIKRLAAQGIKVICYNFMPIFDWTRSDLTHQLKDGSTTLIYLKAQIDKMDPLSGALNLPGWDTSYKKEDLKKLFRHYSNISKEDLWGNLKYFIKEIIPVAIKENILMAIHPDDPPWDIFGLPRLITNEKNIDRFLNLYNSKHNGLTLCSGSLGCSITNNYLEMLDKYTKKDRVPFIHLRNILLLENNSFSESAHFSSCGSLDMVEIMKVLVNNNYQGYVRPDHGRMIFSETGNPGYGLYDRALGSIYLSGIWETLKKVKE